MSEYIHQPLPEHKTSSGTIPAVSELWDANSRLADKQELSIARAALSDGFLGDAPPVFTVDNGVLYWDAMDLLVDGFYCNLSAGNSNDPTFGSPLPPVAAVGKSRIDFLAIDPIRQLNANGFPQSMGKARLVIGQESDMGWETEPNASGSMVVAKVKSVFGSASELIPFSIPKATFTKSLTEFSSIPASGTVVYHASGVHAGMIDYVEKTTPVGTVRQTISYRGDGQIESVALTLNINGFEVKRREVTLNYDGAGTLVGFQENDL